MGTDDRARQFVQRLWTALADAGLPRVAKELVVAQAALESGWGTAKAARLGRNFWNLTRTPNDARPVITGGDLEYDAHGEAHPITQRFRAYASDVEAVRDYCLFLSRPRYDAAWDRLQEGDAEAFASALRASGFYTAPFSAYRAGLVSRLTVVRRLLVGAASPGV